MATYKIGILANLQTCKDCFARIVLVLVDVEVRTIKVGPLNCSMATLASKSTDPRLYKNKVVHFFPHFLFLSSKSGGTQVL